MLSNFILNLLIPKALQVRFVVVRRSGSGHKAKKTPKIFLQTLNLGYFAKELPAKNKLPRRLLKSRVRSWEEPVLITPSFILKACYVDLPSFLFLLLLPMFQKKMILN